MEQQYALPPDSKVDVAFQYMGRNYNIRINTQTGMLVLSELKDKKADAEILFAYNL